MRRLALLVTASIGAVCATYTVIYLVRWEWNRALLAAAFFLAVEILMVGALVLDRLKRLEHRLDTMAATEPQAETLRALQETAPEPPDRFAWLRDRATSTNVFLPVLLGAGVVASALAWVVEHLAGRLVHPSLERRLALRLAVIAPPATGLLGAPPPPFVPTVHGGVRWMRGVRFAAALVLITGAGVGTAAAIDFVADRTQTRPETILSDAETTIDLQLLGEKAARNPERMMSHLWATCTGPGVFPGRPAPEPAISHGQGGLVRVVLGADIGANARERLQGCLNDATIDRMQARVLAISTTT